jgi:hypothetical protein
VNTYRKPHFPKRQCRICGSWITSNALGRASHQRGTKCVPRYTLIKSEKSDIDAIATEIGFTILGIPKGDPRREE